MRFLSRKNNCTQSSASRFFICRVNEGCAMCSFAAAPVKLNSSALSDQSRKVRGARGYALPWHAAIKSRTRDSIGEDSCGGKYWLGYGADYSA
jgi:hypothetical protein